MKKLETYHLRRLKVNELRGKLHTASFTPKCLFASAYFSFSFVMKFSPYTLILKYVNEDRQSSREFSCIIRLIICYTVYPKKYAHGFCFAVLCCGYTLTDFPISIRLASLALWQSNDCPCGNLKIAPVPAKQPWWWWTNTSCEFIMNDCITTTKQSTTKPCAYFLGFTVNTTSLHVTDVR